jgi:hypothetical protein
MNKILAALLLTICGVASAQQSLSTPAPGPHVVWQYIHTGPSPCNPGAGAYYTIAPNGPQPFLWGAVQIDNMTTVSGYRSPVNEVFYSTKQGTVVDAYGNTITYTTTDEFYLPPVFKHCVWIGSYGTVTITQP